jgi:hypothetical protein
MRSKLLHSVRQQGARDVSQLISTSAIISTMDKKSETAIKQIKVRLMNKSGVPAVFVT